MSLRLVEIIVPSASANALADLPHAQDVLARWDDRLQDNVLVRLLVNAEHYVSTSPVYLPFPS